MDAVTVQEIEKKIWQDMIVNKNEEVIQQKEKEKSDQEMIWWKLGLLSMNENNWQMIMQHEY